MRKSSEKVLTVPSIRRRKLGCDIGSFLVEVIPPAAVIASRWDVYTETAAGTWGIGVGGVAILIIAFMAIRGKLKVPNKVLAAVTVAVLAYLLSQVLTDLCLISTTLAGGMVLDELTFGRLAKKYRKELAMREQATATACEMNAGMKNLVKELLEETR